jgi:hypothetical protein
VGHNLDRFAVQVTATKSLASSQFAGLLQLVHCIGLASVVLCGHGLLSGLCSGPAIACPALNSTRHFDVLQSFCNLFSDAKKPALGGPFVGWSKNQVRLASLNYIPKFRLVLEI